MSSCSSDPNIQTFAEMNPTGECWRWNTSVEREMMIRCESAAVISLGKRSRSSDCVCATNSFSPVCSNGADDLPAAAFALSSASSLHPARRSRRRSDQPCPSARPIHGFCSAPSRRTAWLSQPCRPLPLNTARFDCPVHLRRPHRAWLDPDQAKVKARGDLRRRNGSRSTAKTRKPLPGGGCVSIAPEDDGARFRN